MRSKIERLKARGLIIGGGCWLWLGAVDHKGYGRVKHRGRSARVHIVMYELVRGPVPEGALLDHGCRTRHCFNPDCLEPVSNRVNTLRGEGPTAHNARKTHCPRGHALTPNNVYSRPGRRGNRECLTCKKERRRGKSQVPERDHQEKATAQEAR